MSNWYKEANLIASEIASGDVFLGAAMLAVYSPRKFWAQNIKLAEKAIKTRDYSGHFTSQQSKAKKIRSLVDSGEATEEAIKKILGGPKTIAFFENILRPDTSEAVTIDTWMLKWLGLNVSDISTPKKYARWEIHMQCLAKEQGKRPLELQAELWLRAKKN